MKKRPNIKHVLGRTMSLLLVASLTAPSTTPLVAYAAEAMNNRSRLVSFERPEALSIDETPPGYHIQLRGNLHCFQRRW